ncbi:LacI family transcriptional regulator [Cricetibacter osteomyelitidis]|uniref:LacI family transcriptional regulator n=1 Tax=Cricetibacter osteomyelitidis TaxID=1521931 RepID=A0A4V2T1Y7_9PAST|nr:catabolite repressor/activator [Cricetibacter osteomyelitidis]TCP95393.1 LacI family transcriptional regulator [Cricetibacter osteomyelitidis]
MKLADLAKLAGVSRTTASYVVNGKAKQYRVSDKTIEKVTALIREHHFKPNAVAASLRAGKTNTIGLIIPDFENTSYAKIAHQLEVRFRELGYQLIITCSNDDADCEMACARQLQLRQVDALIISTVLTDDSTFYQNYHLPLIGFDRHLPAEHGVNLQMNDEADAYALAQQLNQQTVNRILFIGAMPSLPTSKAREKGFLNGIADKMTVDKCYTEYFRKEDASQLFEQWLEHNELPEVIFTTSFTLLHGVLTSLIKRFRHIPPNIVFATFGNHEMLDLLTNKVIAAEQIHEQIADHLLKLVLAKLTKQRGKKVIEQPAISRELILRN